MRKKAKVIKLESSVIAQEKKKRIQLDSGRQIIIEPSEKEELIQIVEPKGDVVMSIRLTAGGPVITARGAHLELKSMETITLDAKKIEVHAEEESVFTSKGKLKVSSANEMDIHSDDEIRIDGKMIHLN